MSSRAVEGEALGVLWGSRTLRNDDGSIVYDAYGFPEQDQLEGVIGCLLYTSDAPTNREV